MDNFVVLKELKQVKALADPLRQRVLKAFCGNPVTTQQAAVVLGEKSTRLYHHVSTLEKAGLIRVVERRQKRGTVEKYYQAVGRKFCIDRNLLELAPELEEAKSEIQTLIVNTLEDTVFELRDERIRGFLAKETSHEKILFTHARNLCLTPAQIVSLKEKINGWLVECQAECETEVEDKNNLRYVFTAALYPSFEADVE